MAESETLLQFTLALSFGGLLVSLSRKLNVPSIGFLLIGGIFLGPEYLGIIQPEVLKNDLVLIVSLSIGLILFEGGLTLDIKGYQSAPLIIKRLLSVGVFITWFGAAFLIWLIFGHNFKTSLVAGSLVIVTGPTVIQPLLKKLSLDWNLKNILHWESVLIDPIGVFFAILSFEFAIGGGALEAPIVHFLYRVLLGVVMGYASGKLMYYALEKRLFPEEVANVFVFSGALLVYGLSEFWMPESGLLTVTVSGLVLGASQPYCLKSMQRFKAEIIDLLIGMIFILLSARLQLHQFLSLGYKGVFLVGGVIFIIRPLVILVCCWNRGLGPNQKAFLCWIAPRGIVAASMSSLFALEFKRRGADIDATFLETFTYSIIIATVLLQGFTAKPAARLLKVLQKEQKGWLLVGAHVFNRRLAEFIKTKLKSPVVIVDRNKQAVKEAIEEDHLKAICADARDIDFLENTPETKDVGFVLANTDNEELNELLCERWKGVVGIKEAYFWGGVKASSPAIESSMVWRDLPFPSMLSSEILHSEALFKFLEYTDETSIKGGKVLLSVGKNETVLDPVAVGHELNNGDKCLLMTREINYLKESLDADLGFFIDLKSSKESPDGLFSLVKQKKPNLDIEDIVGGFFQNGSAEKILFFEEFCVKEAKSLVLRKPRCVVFRFTEGYSVSRLEKNQKKINFLFVVVAPPYMQGAQLAVTAELTKLLRDEGIRKSLNEAKNINEVYKILLT